MSTALAIAGVTQLLRDLLNDGLVENDVAANIGTNVVVHARPPDLLDPVTNGNSMLNVFLYRSLPPVVGRASARARGHVSCESTNREATQRNSQLV